jgi:hypothetical protein
MILINNILLDEEILEARFACDLSKCKGACCTFPGKLGAPVLDEEVDAINKSIKNVWDYLPEVARQEIKKRGAVEGTPGQYSTVCINDRDCVFVYYEGDVAKCALEKAYFDGKNDFRKPVSCHLYPIRVTDFGGKYLYYSKISECKPAVEHGEKENIAMPDYLKDALTRAFGEEWYEELKAYLEHRKAKDCGSRKST